MCYHTEVMSVPKGSFTKKKNQSKLNKKLLVRVESNFEIHNNRPYFRWSR